MEPKEIAQFTVRVLSTEDATWQGEVVAEDTRSVSRVRCSF